RGPGRRVPAPSWASSGPRSTPHSALYHRDLAISRTLGCDGRGRPEMLDMGVRIYSAVLPEARKPRLLLAFQEDQTMNKTELVDAIAAKTGVTKADAAKVLDGFFEVASEVVGG